MASYAVISNNPVALGNSDVVGLVVTDGSHTVVQTVPDDPCGLHDIDWDTGPEEDVLRAGLSSLSYFTVTGPMAFEGTADDSFAALIRTYGLA